MIREAIGLQSMVASPPKDAAGKQFYAEHDQVVRRVVELQGDGLRLGVAMNATAIFQAGARSVDAMIEAAGRAARQDPRGGRVREAAAWTDEPDIPSAASELRRPR